jgi:hypothetical protein
VKEEIYVIKRLMNAYDVGQRAGDGSAIGIGRKFLKENEPEQEITITPSKLRTVLRRTMLKADNPTGGAEGYMKAVELELFGSES